MNALNQLKAVLVFIAIVHLVFGFDLMFSIDFQKTAIANYGGTLDWSTTNIYFIKIIGSFAFVLGYLAWMASRDPQCKPDNECYDFSVFWIIKAYLDQPTLK